MNTGPVGIGVIGAGNISDEYLRAMTAAADLRVIAIADLDAARAAAQADAYGIAHAATPEALLARDDVELIVNLTIPAAHAEVGLAAIEAGKHVWAEKPMALRRDDARRLLEAAGAAGLVVGNAPDTILGEGIQHSQHLLDDGEIGAPRTLLTLMQGPGPDSWHPRPQFLFARGAGPLFDIGPYYVSTMVQLLGSIVEVEALGSRPRATRVVGSGPDAGTEFPVEVWTHVSALLRFESGVVGTSVYSFDSWVERQLFDVTGDAGTLEVPVSGFDGPTRIAAAGTRGAGWRESPPPGTPRARGTGVVEMARAIRAGVRPRASGELALHALDVMLAIEESADAGGRTVALATRAPRVEPLPTDWDPTAATLPDAGSSS
ncbi:Gfo/Idh/MocA family oxidoreductase [Pseudolysinimonas kribbensis]|uniref:Oxidoreductase n=1 Tax=Pseudolysinimonas kribbensis TaxID=433641 RepID=A0ABQ6K8N1_9MICO|nr:Gfo/Idh/MocA family oxidoreductase [Pseudolysinimonas kribbensis]GMA95960.1 oxidoreductase [Pseudolysinimonas kribbensis]